MKPEPIGIDDSVTACDCCGRTGLKSTVLCLVDGERRNYGCVCVTRHTGLDTKGIKAAITAHTARMIVSASRKVRTSPEYAAYQAALSAAHSKKLIGRAFRDACAAEHQALRVLLVGIASDHGLAEYQINA